MLARDAIGERVAAAVEAAQRQGLLPASALPGPAVERPQKAEHGDFASSVPLRLARGARMAPMEIAERLAALVEPPDSVSRVWAAPPGFVNFALSEDWLRGQVDAILAAGAGFGGSAMGGGRRVQVEFVSANPTGPLHVGGGAWGGAGFDAGERVGGGGVRGVAGVLRQRRGAAGAVVL